MFSCRSQAPACSYACKCQFKKWVLSKDTFGFFPFNRQNIKNAVIPWLFSELLQLPHLIKTTLSFSLVLLHWKPIWTSFPNHSYAMNSKELIKMLLIGFTGMDLNWLLIISFCTNNVASPVWGGFSKTNFHTIVFLLSLT